MQYFHQGGAHAGADGVGTYDGSTLNTVSTFGDTLRAGDTLPAGGSGTFVRTESHEAYVASGMFAVATLLHAPTNNHPPTHRLGCCRPSSLSFGPTPCCGFSWEPPKTDELPTSREDLELCLQQLEMQFKQDKLRLRRAYETRRAQIYEALNSSNK